MGIASKVAIETQPNKQIEDHHVDGTKEISYPDGTKRTIYTNGTTDTRYNLSRWCESSSSRLSQWETAIS
jgi:hypothetical protein